MGFMGYALGDEVCWYSQASGTLCMKTGRIVMIVPENVPPPDYRSLMDEFKIGVSAIKFKSHWIPSSCWEYARNHESYIIYCNGKLYRPYTSSLRHIKYTNPPAEKDPLRHRNGLRRAFCCLHCWHHTNCVCNLYKISVKATAVCDHFRMTGASRYPMVATGEDRIV